MMRMQRNTSWQQSIKAIKEISQEQISVDIVRCESKKIHGKDVYRWPFVNSQINFVAQLLLFLRQNRRLYSGLNIFVYSWTELQ